MLAAWPDRSPTTVAVAHDYLTQRGGAERVVLELLRALPGAPVYTSIYAPPSTFDAFAAADVRTSRLDRVPGLRRDHRLALPLLAPAFSRLRVDAEVLVCSSSGWAHGARTTGRKVVYCHNPARWLYQRERYLREGPRAGAAALAVLRPWLARWDLRAAATADRYLVNSRAVQQRVREIYGIDAEVLHPPPALLPDGRSAAPAGIEPGFVLCVSRLLPYKNVDAVLAAFASLAPLRVVVVGRGPDERRLRSVAPPNASILTGVPDEELRWLYGASAGLVAASHEDFGLTPLEAAAAGKPTAALRFGGYLDTVVPGDTGILFDTPTPAAVADAVRELVRRPWDEEALRRHADRFSAGRFHARIREVVDEERAAA